MRSPWRSTRLEERAGVAQRERADEHAVDAGGERLVDRLGRAEAAADLQPAALARDEAREQRAVLLAALSGARGVQIDHVQPARALRREAVGEGFGIGAEVGRRVEASLDEPHDVAVDEIDGGEDIHAFTVQNPTGGRMNVLP